MKRVLIACIAAAGIAACGSETSFPEATGKGGIRAINAIPTSPDIAFLIEERGQPLAVLGFRDGMAPQDWDDLEFTFNFEVQLLQDSAELTRVASEFVDVAADTEYTMLISGDLAAPTITVWEIPEREFNDSDTVFEMRIGHAADALDSVDVYFALDGVAPLLGEQIATLAPGEVSTAGDFEQDDYVITVTAPDDPANVLYQSVTATIVQSQSVLITIFEGDANDPAPVTATIFNQVGASTTLPDDRFLPTLRFIHATMDLATADIYDDETLTNRIAADLAFGGATVDIDVAAEENPITFTAAGNPGAILFEDSVTSVSGGRINVNMTVADDALAASLVAVDRRSIETMARLTFFHSAINHQSIDLYVVDSGETIDDVLPRQSDPGYGFQAPAIVLGEGSFDIYVTTSGEKTILDGPIPLDALLGDVHEAVLLDRVDPALAEFRILPSP